MSEWHLKEIPKTLHMYWGRNKKLSYMRYMTAYSFSKLNPDWKINVYAPLKPCLKQTWNGNEQKAYNYRGNDHFPLLSRIKNVNVIEFDFEATLHISNDKPEDLKSDILRLHLISTQDGGWSA